MSRKGLTLVELLLVIGIIAVLAGIIWVIGSVVRKRIWIAQCSANLRQIGFAIQLYRQDHDDYFPEASFRIDQYLRDKRILVCPEDTEMVPVLKTTSSYTWRSVLPDGRRIFNLTELNPNVVLVSCQHHFGIVKWVRYPDTMVYSEPTWPFELVLRESGTVQPVHMCSVKKADIFLEEFKRWGFTVAYPEEPWYEKLPKYPFHDTYCASLK